GTRSPWATAGNGSPTGWNSTPPSATARKRPHLATDAHEPGPRRHRLQRHPRRRGREVAAAHPARRAARVLLARAGPGAARGAGAAGRPAGDGAGALAPGARWQRAHAAAAAGKAVGAAAAPPGAGAGRAPGRLRPARDRPTVRRTPRGAGVRQRLLPGPFRPG